MAEIVLKNLEKVYPSGFKAVHGINLHIKDGEFMVFVGPSGCGKSTILRTIAGLEEATSGEIWIGDKLVNKLPPKERKIAMVFQNYTLYPHMTIYENMAFGLKMAKVPKNEIEKRVKDIAERLEITELLDRKPKEISGGQKQRTAVGRAIIRKPDIFLFDEPLSNLDAKLRVSMRVEITQLHKQLKAEGQSATMIYVTHDQIEAMTMGDRICVLNSGKIMQVDTPENLYRNPVNKFTAEFIGSPAMNFVDGVIEKNEKNLMFVFGKNRQIILSEKIENKIKDYIGKPVLLGIRPEDIGVVQAEYGKDKRNSLDGNIKAIEYLGNEKFIYFTIDEVSFISRTETEKSEKISAGNVEKFYFNEDKILLFDKNTEGNITFDFCSDIS